MMLLAVLQYVLITVDSAPANAAQVVSVAVVGDCAPTDDGKATGFLDVAIEPDSGAVVTVGGTEYTSSTKGIPVEAPGVYSWSAVAQDGFVIQGAASGKVEIEDCKDDEPATVTVSGTCVLDESGLGSGRIDILIEPAGSATVTIAGEVYSATTSGIVVPSGETYPWTAVEESGFEIEGPDYGELVIEDCSEVEIEPVTVSVTGSCVTEQDGSASGRLSVDIEPTGGATVTLAGSAYTSSSAGIVVAADASYPWSATAEAGYEIVGDSSGTVVIDDCSESELNRVTVSVTGSCLTEDDGSASGLLDVSISADDAVVLTVGGQQYTGTTTGIPVAAPGSYPWSAVAEPGYVIVSDSSGTVSIEDCSETTTSTTTSRPTTPPPDITSALGDFVWFDENQNGVQDEPTTEFAIPGATVTLLSSDGMVLAQQVTGEDGLYLFDDLEAGSYRVQVCLAGADYTITNAGSGDGLDSDVFESNPSDGCGLTALINLPAGVTDLTWDAGIVLNVEGIQIETTTTTTGEPTTTTTIQPVTVGTLPFTGLGAGQAVLFSMAALGAGALLLAAMKRRDEGQDAEATMSGWMNQ
jgi:hypothetical protein